MAILGVTLASCGKREGEAAPQPATDPATTAAAPAAGGAAQAPDPCSLVADAQSLFGTPVTSSLTQATGTAVCEWKSDDGRICGSVTLFTPAANSSADPKVNYAGLVSSLGAFGEVKEVAGIGEEARMVDGGMLGAQVALRTASAAALAGSACRSGPHGQVELAQRLAREIAGRL